MGAGGGSAAPRAGAGAGSRAAGRRLPDLPAALELERAVRADWDRHGVHARALAHRADAARSFVFYEGPPTANGRPALHHVFSRTLKDVVCRHRLMTGHRVPRKAGWDTQGLPVEIEVQKELGITTRDQIESLAGDPRASIAEFNRLCRESVFRNLADWKELSLRMAYWLDYEHPYVTYETPYIESCWAILSRFHREGMLVRDFKVLAYCPLCQTGLSNHEVALGYEDVQDPSVFVRFRVRPEDWQRHMQAATRDADLELQRHPEGISLLVWTTTPWTLFANVAVAIAEDREYALVRVGEALLVVQLGLVERLFGGDADVVSAIDPLHLLGLPYQRPLDVVPMADGQHALTVRFGDFVSSEDGTGIVHIAPAFGADDFSLRQKDGLPLLKPVDDGGRFTAEVGPEFAGRFVKEADKDIIRRLKDEGLLFRQQTVDHSYPHCWRCRSPLLYMARPSWYLLTTRLRDRMVALNGAIDWHPPEIGTGRFGEWLDNNVDWAISRERYWGTPLNVWVCDACGHERAPESLAALGGLAGRALPEALDPHRPGIDDVTFACAKDGCAGTMRRTPEVIDCWFDSGAMPFAQAGWPASTGGALPRDFPADFISEGLDQTRGWFYTLHVLAAFVSGLPEHADEAAARGARPGGALPAYRACLVNNLLLDAQGKKMSKSRGNIVDPWELFDTVGADALRWYFLASGQVWTPKRFDGKALAEAARRTFGTLRNCYAFLALYANLDGWTPGDRAPPARARPAIDRWLVSRLATLAHEVGAAYAALDLTEATRLLDRFIDAELSNWYVRRNRARFWKSGDDADKRAAFATLAAALERVALLAAPIAPFLTEALWRAVTGAPPDASVHLADWPEPDAGDGDPELERRMGVVLDAVELGRSVRAAHDLRVRQPLRTARLKAADPGDAARLRDPDLSRLLSEELNVKSVQVVDRADFRTLTAKPDFKRLGPRFGTRMKAVAAAVAALDEAALEAYERDGRLELDVAGDEGGVVELGPGDLALLVQGRPGFAVAADGRLVLALDTRLDDALVAEGRAREIVNRVQNTRKSSGLDVSDRVVVHLDGDAALLEAARRHERLILDEVLGLRMELGAAPADAQEFDVDGARLRVAVERV
jgi:isoleucyl-tRNA synthetase